LRQLIPTAPVVSKGEKKILAAIHFFKLSSPCGLYYKINMVTVSGDRNKIIMTIVSDLP
jgi:hypothetical protein